MADGLEMVQTAANEVPEDLNPIFFMVFKDHDLGPDRRPPQHGGDVTVEPGE